MKCISIQQPWAWLIVSGKKDCENRSWYTSYRGLILIHAGKKIDVEGYRFLTCAGIALPRVDHLVQFACGAIVGSAFLYHAAWKSNEPSAWEVEGQCHFYLRDAIRFSAAIPMKGQLGIFDVPDDICQMCAGRQ